jgi:RNA polymerase sigma-70 factor, ECF subfamily
VQFAKDMELERKTGGNNISKDLDSFKSVFDTYYKNLVVFAESYLLNRAAAEDVVQTVFEYIWQRDTWRDPAISIRAYLYTAVKNRCINEIRHRNVKDVHDLRYVQAMLNVREDSGDHELLQDELRKCISTLPTQIRRIIELRYFEGKSVIETASILKISPNTVKTQIKRGRAHLKVSLLDVKVKIFLLLVTHLID